MWTPQQTDVSRERYANDGFVVLPSVVDRTALGELSRAIRQAFDDVRARGATNEVGGMVSGHLNCFPGRQSEFVYERLQDSGVLDFARGLGLSMERPPNIGCNFNMPGSHHQNLHIDGYVQTPFMVINVAVVDTVVQNGAIEVVPYSHRQPYKYWSLKLSPLKPVQQELRAGDVLVRSSVLWHRGMPNHAGVPRPMLGYTWEDGGSKLDDPYSVHDGKIAFLTNRYGTDLAGRLKERAFAAAPSLGSGYLFARSLVQELDERLSRN